MILLDSQTLALMVALLLGLWLLLRVNREQTQRTPERRRPLTPNELARMVMETARADDRAGWRSLFLMGAESTEVMGAQADRFLAACRGPRLAEALQLLRAQLPTGATFLYGRQEHDGRCYMHLRDREIEAEIYFGRAVKVGAVLRMVEPASGSLVV
jgi:hypothetical protein